MIIFFFLRVIPENIVFDRRVVARFPLQCHAVGAGSGGQVLGNTGGLVHAADNIAHHGYFVAAHLNVPGGKLPLEAVIRVSGGDIRHGAGAADLTCDGRGFVAALGMLVVCADHKAAGAAAAADRNVMGIALGKGLTVLLGNFLRDDGIAL